MTTAPDKLLLRRGEAISFLEVNKHVFAELVEAGLITGRKINNRGRCFFARTQLMRVKEELGRTEQTMNAALCRDAATGNKGK